VVQSRDTIGFGDRFVKIRRSGGQRYCGQRPKQQRQDKHRVRPGPLRRPLCVPRHEPAGLFSPPARIPPAASRHPASADPGADRESFSSSEQALGHPRPVWLSPPGCAVPNRGLLHNANLPRADNSNA
jgi:hypothetical protein